MRSREEALRTTKRITSTFRLPAKTTAAHVLEKAATKHEQ